VPQPQQQIAQLLLDPQPDVLARHLEAGKWVCASEDDMIVLDIQELRREGIGSACDLSGCQQQRINAGGAPGRSQCRGNGCERRRGGIVQEDEDVDVALAGAIPAARETAIENEASKVPPGRSR
jgi:hypothetical protein